MDTETTDFEEVLPCAEKLVFLTKKEAQGSVVVVEYQHGTKVKPYKCVYCKLWHLATDYDEDNK